VIVRRRPRRLFSAILATFAIATGGLVIRTVAQSLPSLCAPLGCFAPGTEGELWRSLPPFGIPDDGTCSNADPNADNATATRTARVGFFMSAILCSARAEAMQVRDRLFPAP